MNFFIISALFFATVCYAVPIPSIDDNRIDTDLDVIDLTQYGSAIFGVPSNRTGHRVAQYDPTRDQMNPEELGEYLEGDMLMTPDFARNGLIATSSHWPGAVVPFEIAGYFNAIEMDLIEQAINEYHRRTCVKWRPRTYEKDYVSFTNQATGCWSSVGRIGGRQSVNLQTPGCIVKVGTVIHEMMHALGFFHEQNRNDRDDFVYINWNNVRSGTQANFDKQSSLTTSPYGVDYDYGSVMHYSANAFSRNGQPTITAKKNGSNNMGQRDAFSSLDVQKVNKMYKCPDKEILDTHRPYGNGNSTNNGGGNEDSSNASTTTESTPASTDNKPPTRPNRPLLNLIGSVLGQALVQGTQLALGQG